ncbi:Protoporphyrinogen oxidase [Halorubrum aquaticum]|uniref:Protoporphyrinogen oxidase n=1 Tax=Halorubrum aquaticum TaxID=387340 RepID=A0A1I3BJM2_9EURY|nr:FAD-dependent oxidoreductase [Halorubrum aquaticum]SFH62468.1 Protoporphyrinogen oxidase [Halorubrum aquaticum]
MYGVVGGGLAGLSAAVRLREAGHAVRVFEASDAVGGRARTVDTAGDPVARFPHYLSPTDDALQSLATDLGLGERIVRGRGRTARYRDGVVHRIDAPWERLAYPGTGLVDAARARRLARAVRSLGGAPADLDATTVEAFVADRASRATYEGYVEPVLRAEFGDRAGDVSAAWLAEWLRSREARGRSGTSVGHVDGSTARLVDALVESIGEEAVRTGSRVAGIGLGVGDDAGSGGPVSLAVETPTGRRVVECAGVVVAEGPAVLEDLTGIDPGVEAIPGASALVTTDDPIVDSWRVTVEPGALSGGEDAPFGTLFGHTNLVPPERYGSDHLTYLVGRGGSLAGGSDGDEDDGSDGDDVDDERLRDRWLSALADLFPSVSREDVRSVRVARDPAAAVAAPPGEVLSVDLGEVGVPGVAYAGPGSRLDRFGGSLDARVAAGVAAAEAVAGVGTTGSGATDDGTTADPASDPDGAGFEWE